MDIKIAKQPEKKKYESVRDVPLGLVIRYSGEYFLVVDDGIVELSSSTFFAHVHPFVMGMVVGGVYSVTVTLTEV